MCKSFIMKNFALNLFFFLSALVLNAQEYKQLDLFTKRQILNGNFKKQDINVLVKGDLNAIKKAAEVNGALYKYGYGNIAAVNVPLEKFDAFSNAEGIEFIENVDLPIVPLAENSVILSNVLPVHNGQSPLTQAYKGDGVIMGIIDDGIDFRHADFRKADSTTRIRYIWDQRAAAVNSPLPYSYGREWSAAEIDAGICTHVEPANKFGHGSTVSGIACGNGKATGRFVGMAPNTEIVFVAINSSGNFLSTVLDGINYIFKKADALGKPVSINISYGTYFGSRDAKDLASLLVEELLEERSGRVVVAAAGNAGEFNYHLGYDVNADTSFTWFKLIPSEGDLYWQLWADTADFKNVEFAFANDSIGDTISTLKKRTPFINVKRNYNLNPGILDVQQFNLFLINDSTNATIGTILTQLTHDNGRYLLEVIIKPQVATNLWRFITTGSGKFDVWSSTAIMGTSDMILDFPSNLDTSKVPGLNFYKFPDKLKTMVSSIQNSDKVITVANYQNNEWFLNACGDTTFTGVNSGTRAEDSSVGPTRDGRQKPDITAPGGFTLSVGNLNNIASLLATNQCFKVADTRLHQTNGGTSMASPCVAGVSALLLQQNNDAWWYEIKSKLIASARKDTITGNNLPDNKWGYGKLNAFDAFFISETYGCTNPDAINYDATAQFDDGSCILPIYGCLDPTAINYDSLANTSDTCIYYVFNSIDNKSGNYLNIFPNPTTNYVSVNYSITENTDAKIIVNDVLGNILVEEFLLSNNGVVKFNTNNFSKGTYVCRIINTGNTIAIKKIFKF